MGVSFFPMISLAMYMVSCGVRDSRPLYLSSTSWPLTSICGARPGEKIRSLTCGLDFSIAVTSWAAWMVRCAAGGDEGVGPCGVTGCGGIVGVAMHLMASVRG